MSEKYLRQYIKEAMLLESKRIDEAPIHMAAALAAKKIADRKKASISQKSSSRSSSSKEYPRSSSRRNRSGYIAKSIPAEAKIEGHKNALKYVSWRYSKHVEENWPDYMDWKEWLFTHEDGGKIIIKKQGNKYIINPDSIGDPKDGKFEQIFIDELEEDYEDTKKRALAQVRTAKHRGH